MWKLLRGSKNKISTPFHFLFSPFFDTKGGTFMTLKE